MAPGRAGPKETRRRGDPGRIRPGVRLGPELGDEPDTRGPPGGETGRGGGCWAGLGQERGAGSGPAGKEFLCRGVKKKEKETGWAGLKEREKEKGFSIFQNDSNTFNLNSNSKI